MKKYKVGDEISFYLFDHRVKSKKVGWCKCKILKIQKDKRGFSFTFQVVEVKDPEEVIKVDEILENYRLSEISIM